MSLIQQLAEKRRLILDGIEANDGDINLGIFEDFYPDEAHFVFELLQNAEDAGATEVGFELSAHRCSFEHNGTRHFDERESIRAHEERRQPEEQAVAHDRAGGRAE